jgi:AcrR family transcriptional regulator
MMDADTVPPRRLGLEGSQNRARFIDAAEEVLRDEGLPALTARQVAAKAGLKTQLLYYYFRTMDDLILALVRRVNEHRMERFEAALASPEPLRALWRLNSDPSGASLASELTSIATHREAIRAEIVRSAQTFRAMQIEAVSRLLGQKTGANGSAAGIVMIAVALARTIVAESSLGLTEGHEEALAIIEQTLQRLSAPAP